MLVLLKILCAVLLTVALAACGDDAVTTKDAGPKDAVTVHDASAESVEPAADLTVMDNGSSDTVLTEDASADAETPVEDASGE